MNFLAHILLSGDDEEIIIGNFIGDFVKGSQLNRYSEGIQKGIQLHRVIDQFTDSHPTVLGSKKRLRPNFRHYAPVIVDVFYDHFVAKKWSQFSTEPLLDFTLRFYQLMDKYCTEIPKAVSEMLVYMHAGNWLYNYQYIEGINSTLTGMAKRTTFDSKMEMAAAYLEKDYAAFEEEFSLFFPELQQYVNNFQQ
ncbi:MAG: ACP phosphodiesterase [Ekhidna sp.]|nr:ACP phosphodiesterase [Ekhidna sp.]